MIGLANRNNIAFIRRKCTREMHNRVVKMNKKHRKIHIKRMLYLAKSSKILKNNIIDLLIYAKSRNTVLQCVTYYNDTYHKISMDNLIENLDDEINENIDDITETDIQMEYRRNIEYNQDMANIIQRVEHISYCRCEDIDDMVSDIEMDAKLHTNLIDQLMNISN